ncbi:MAG TPA: hypothetical protein VMM15_42000 [Bradyrhizobium sp.]|nr:hypothetical protein [Bradyrhizobium sp.]
MRKIPEVSGIETGKVSQFSPSEAPPFRGHEARYSQSVITPALPPKRYAQADRQENQTRRFEQVQVRSRAIGLGVYFNGEKSPYPRQLSPDVVPGRVRSIA